MEAETGKSGVRFEFELTTSADIKISMDMEKQEKIIREFFSKIQEQQGQSPKELPPRAGEKYRFAWRAKGDEGKSYYELFQMGDCLYLTADTDTRADSDEYKLLQLLNWLNGWSHYGIFTHSPHEKIVCYEQTLPWHKFEGDLLTKCHQHLLPAKSCS